MTMAEATIVKLDLPASITTAFGQATERAVVLRGEAIHLPPGTREICGKNLDDLLDELDRHGRTEVVEAWSSEPGRFRCECRIEVQASTVYVKGFGQTRLEAAANCLVKVVNFKSLEK
jgi:hypothetical protein